MTSHERTMSRLSYCGVSSQRIRIVIKSCHAATAINQNVEVEWKAIFNELTASFMKCYILNPISSGVFFPWVLRGGADSAHHFETPVRVGFAILTSF